MNRIVLDRYVRGAARAADGLLGRLRPLQPVLDDLALKPAMLGLEFTNLCNADCVFCPYQHQQRAHEFMSDEVFHKAVADYVAIGGGNVELTPVVGDALIHPEFLARVRFLRSLPAVGRIILTTNAILLDKHGVDEVISSGINEINISTAGFERAMYERVYRSSAYERMRRNVLALVERNAALGRPVNITIALRPDRPLEDVLRDPDFQPILAHRPRVHANRMYSDAGGRIAPATLPGTMPLRVLRPHPLPCAYTYYGPIVLSNGAVLVCNCLAGVDGERDLGLGNIMTQSLGEIWRSERLRQLRASFGTPDLNPTCAGCTMYHDVNVFRSRDRRAQAAANRAAAEAASSS